MMDKRNMSEDLRAMLDQVGYDKVLEAMKAIQKEKEAEEAARKEAARKASEAARQAEAENIAGIANRLLNGGLTDEDMAFIYRKYMIGKGVSEKAVEIFTSENMSELTDMMCAFNPIWDAVSEMEKSVQAKVPVQPKSKVTVKSGKDADAILRDFLNSL